MKVKILSALIMLAVFIPLLITGGEAFAVLMSLLSVAGLYEILHIRETKKQFPFMMKVFAYILVMFFSLNNFTTIEFTSNLDYRVISFIIFIFLTPMIFINDNKKFNLNDALFLIGSTLFIGLSFNLIIIIRNYDILYIVYLFLISIFTDTFGLFAGKLIGHPGIVKDISPNKTLEGYLVGSFMGTCLATIFYHVVINSSLPLVILILITFTLSIISQFGDLVFSDIKRYYGKKDYSNIIPGHGGVLDRFDSIIFVVLAYILFVGII